MLAVRSLHIFPLHLAEQVALPHQAQLPLVIYCPSLPFELPRDPSVAVTRKLKTDGFNAIPQVSLRFHLVRAFGFALMIEGAPGNIH